MRTRFSATQLMSMLALFIALGGSAYAAAKITGTDVKDGSLTGKDIKSGSLTGKDIKSGSLVAANFKNGQLPAGKPGAAGAPGTPGTPGAPCPATDPACRGPQGPAGPGAVKLLKLSQQFDKPDSLLGNIGPFKLELHCADDGIGNTAKLLATGPAGSAFNVSESHYKTSTGTTTEELTGGSVGTGTAIGQTGFISSGDVARTAGTVWLTTTEGALYEVTFHVLADKGGTNTCSLFGSAIPTT